MVKARVRVRVRPRRAVPVILGVQAAWRSQGHHVLVRHGTIGAAIDDYSGGAGRSSTNAGDQEQQK